MNKSVPRKQDLTQSVHRVVKTLIGRKDAYKMQILQHGNTLRWARITLLSDPAAQLIRMKIHVLSDSFLCAFKNWATKLEDVWNEHGFVETNEFGSPRSAIHWHVFAGVSTVDIMKHFRKYLNGHIPESFDEGIIFMSLSHDIEWTQKGNTDTGLHNAKEVASFATQFRPKHWCFLRRMRGGTEIPTILKEHDILSQCKWVDVFKCHTSHPMFPANS